MLPGDAQRVQRSVISSHTSVTGSNTTRQIPARLFYDQQSIHRNTLVLEPTQHHITTATNTSSQTNMNSFIAQRPINTTKLYGEPMGPKAPNVYRIISNNIGCLGMDSIGNSKQNSLKDWLVQNEVDIVGWQEIGLAQHMFQKHERLAERLRDYRRKQIRVSSSNNKHEAIEKFQWGGTATIAYDTLANMARSSGADEDGIGRWSWIQLEGHNNRRIRVISAYNPCRTTTSQFATVYAQQKRYWLSQHKDVCPRQKFRIDLCNLCSKWIQQGEYILLLIDCNENLSLNLDLQSHLTAEPLNLVDPIRSKYPTDQPLPPTTTKGSYPIDGIFMSPEIADIVRGGWLELGVGFSDHRILYIDVDMFKFLGKHKNSTAPHKIRRLQCRDPRTIHAFNTCLEKQYKYHNVHNKLTLLDTAITTQPTQEQLAALYRLDNINTQLIIHAEKKCRKLRMGAHPYTPETAKLGLTIEFWRALIRKHEGHNISSSYLRRTARQCDIHNYSIIPLEECIREKRMAYKNYKTAIKTVNRPSFLDDLADAIAADGDLERSTVIRQLKSQEESRHMHKEIRNSTKEFSGAPYHMELPSDNGPYISTDKEEIEKALMAEYEAKYRLAEASPFLKEPLLSELGPLALNDNAERILNGTYQCPPGIDKYTKCFIKHLARDPIMHDQPDNETVITVDQLNQFWNNMDEKIVSSPSGRHIGTYKATSIHPTNSVIQARLTSLPFELGIPLPRTTQCINVSLLKKGKGITPADLRTIWLLEADFNAGAKIHWVKRMMNETGIGKGLIPDSQYAKRGNKAIEAALVKVLFFDHIRQNKQPGIIFASDLMQCFDRMAHPVCSLVSRRMGVPQSVIKCMLLTIQQMTHRVRTGYGDSSFTYGNDSVHPLQGGGQGNGASLPLWLAISCILIAMLEDRVIGVRLQTAVTLQIIIFIAIMYVDDTDILLSDITGTDSLDDVFYRATRAARTWEEAVIASGGAVRPEKCYWTAIDFRWKNGKWSYMKMNEFQGEIWVKNTHGVKEKVKRFDVNRSKDGLGLHIHPDGSMDQQIEFITEKIQTWNGKLKRSALSKHHTLIAANTSIFRTIIYGLPGCCYSVMECRKLENILYSDLMPKMGLSSKLPLPYRYGGLACQGIGLLHIHLQMLIEQIRIFLEHIQLDTQLGVSYRATLESAQLEIGSMSDLFSLPYHSYHFFTTDTWIKNLWFCLDRYKIKLKKASSLFKPQRENDISLMDAVVKAKLFTNAELAKINLCRVYLRVFYLSDICSGNGRGLMHNYKIGYRSEQRISKWKWPRQQRPNAQAWKLWNAALTDVWIRSETHSLLQPLGNWITSSHQQFTFFLDPKINSVIETRSNNSFHVYFKTEQRTRNCSLFRYKYTIFRTKQRWIPITAEKIDYDTVIAEPMMEQLGHIPQIIPYTLKQFITARHPYYSVFFKHATILNSGADIEHALRSQKAIAVTDASVSLLTQYASVSWIITDTKSVMCGEGLSGCPILYHSYDSYGSELYGILCILIAVKMVVEFRNIQDGVLTIACDNDSSLDNGTVTHQSTKTDPAYFDLLWEISDLIRNLPIKIQKKNVKGHAEDFKIQLNKYEKLNTLMDRRAKIFRRELEKKIISHSPVHFGSKFYSIWINNTRISTKLEHNIKDFVHGSALRLKLIQKGDISAEGVTYIDWDAIGMAGKSLTAYEKLWVTKFTSGFCGTASQMHYRYNSKKKKEERKQKEALEQIDNDSDISSMDPIQLEDKHAQWDSNLCPLCGNSKENTKHVVVCEHTEALTYRIQQFKLFSTWLLSQRSDPSIRECIDIVLTSHTQVTFLATMKCITTSKLHLEAAKEQDEIGYTNFLFGRLSKKWREIQRQHLLHSFPSKNYSADAWIRRVIARIYRVTQSLWKFRCEFVHGVESVLTSKREKKALRTEIIKQFKLGTDGVRGTDKHLFSSGLSHILSASIREQKYWLRTIQLSRAFIIEREKNMFVGMRSIMLQWAKPPD